MVRGVYDLQKLRIQMGNRIVANYKTKLGQAPSHPEEELDEDAQAVLKLLRSEHKLITNGIVAQNTGSRQKKQFKGTEVIDSYAEYAMLSQYVELESKEKYMFNALEVILTDYPIYNSFLKDVRGVGPAMAAVIISEFDISKAKYVSSLWKYAGLDVAEDGKARSKRQEHLRTVEYVSSEGETKLKASITFNPFLRTKLLGVLAASFLRSGGSKYSEVYYNYKNRLENSPKHQEKTKKHRHMMAMRYMVKIFLMDLYANWRAVEGLPVHPPYAEAKLGLKHGVDVGVDHERV
ncbi:hypothetical protein C4564_01830 [Candidatus Microgenomates bacterium]|nr:MAG: hypothetical protein C4564_01830 [Candidatus Microgenomates bacterium]